MQSNFRKSLFPSILIYIVIGLLLIGGIVYALMSDFNISTIFAGDSGIKVESYYGDTDVYIDGDLVGTTPYSSDSVKAVKHTVTVQNSVNKYETKMDFEAGTQVALNRDLGTSEVFSSGQNFWLEKSDVGAVLSVISNPSNAVVRIDNTEVGNAPYSVDNLSEGDYDLSVSLPGYETQNARLNIKSGYKLNVLVELFPLPVPAKVEEFESSDGLYNIVSNNSDVTNDVLSWIAAILYWNETRGINLIGTGLNKEHVFDYFIDYMGNLYDSSGVLLSSEDQYPVLEDSSKGAYLSRFSDGGVLSSKAAEVYQMLSGKALMGKGAKAEILSTGLGWLRVRNAPNLDGTEVTRVNVGDSFDVLEQTEGWVKIKIDDATEGWVSSDYVSIPD